MVDKLLGLLGLARQGGRLAVGEKPVEDACRLKKARLVLTASDAAENSVSKAKREAEYAGIPHVSLPWDKETLGAALGRSLCAVAALLDAGLARTFAERLAAGYPAYAELAAGLNPPKKRSTDIRRTDSRSPGGRSH